MGVEIISNPLSVSALLSGEIDHHTAAAMRADIDAAAAAQQPKILRLDFADVTFMDSSAVGLVMGRYRLLQGWQGKLEVTNLSERNYKMMRLAGMQTLCTLSQKRNKEDKQKKKKACRSDEPENKEPLRQRELRARRSLGVCGSAGPDGRRNIGY